MKKLLATSLSLALASTAFLPFSSASASELEPPTNVVTSSSTSTAIPEQLAQLQQIQQSSNLNNSLNPVDSPTGGFTTFSIEPPDTGGSESWVFWTTDYYNQKLQWTTMASAASALGIILKIPNLSLAGVVGNYIISNKGSWLYIRDVKYFRMIGGVMQVQHNVSYYTNSSMTTKVGSSVTYITNYS
ncbi:hypothetical protein [Neobacillus jeddahensis]|uniref:hypothetical protein n=1 Tax=Neobacillus jeddahensis TaxID=1461580 RepID=UPI0005A6BA48|nr:hypothetical protein [Neobacillus jeddahensis]